MRTRLFLFFLFIIVHIKTCFSQTKNDFTAIDTVFKSKEYNLSASLKLPINIKKVPCVIFLNGSGPIDKDGTVGPNKIALDITTALAKNGIATFVYDKRTVNYAKEIKAKYDSFTVIDEYVDDAIAAIEFVGNIKGVDAKNIFLIGHSQGANIIPFIYNKRKTIKGIVLLAGTAKPMEELVLSQFKYLLSLDSSNKIIKAQYAKMQNKMYWLTQVYSGKYLPYDSLPLNLPSKYWVSLKATSVGSYLPLVKCPVLLLQGNRDYQVNPNEFKNLSSLYPYQQKKQTFLLDSLNHFFIAGTGTPGPLEYSFPKHVSPIVAEKIEAFILKYQ